MIALATSWVTLLAAGLAGVLLLLSAPIMAAMTTGLGQEARVLAVDAFRVAIPILLVGGVLAVWTSALQAIEVFGMSSFALMLIPATPPVLVAAIGSHAGAIAVAWGVTSRQPRDLPDGVGRFWTWMSGAGCASGS